MKARQIWKFTGSLIGLLALLAILIAVNILVSRVRLRADLTEEKLYTLSEGTRTVLKSLQEPVTLKFFFSSGPETPMPLKHFAQQVQDLLKEYELASGGMVRIETYDPEPDSDAEEWAQRYGLDGESLGMMHFALYMGLVAVLGDTQSVIPFIDPRNEERLEYNITRMIARIANPKKPVVGVMSSLPVMGVRSFPYAMPGQPRPQNRPPWVAFQDLKKDYDVRTLATDATEIDPECDVLVVVHPRNLPEQTVFAIDQFVLRGGRLLAFIDPLCLADAMNQEKPMDMTMARPMSDLLPLTTAWGINYEPEKVVADLAASTRVRRGDNTIEDNPVFLSLRSLNIDGKDILTSSLESLSLPVAGAFTGTGTDGLSVGSLLVSSEQSALISVMAAQMGDAAIRNEFKSGLKRLNVAIRLQGKFKTAFPQGRPKPASEDGKDQVEQKEKEPEDTAPALTESARAGTVILVADVDMLYDAFAVQEIPIFGQRVFQPLNDNINFFANAVEQLSGNTALAQIRARGRFDRPFERVQELQREAQERWMMQERALQEEMASTQARLEELQAHKDKSQRYILSTEQEQEIENFKQQQIKIQRELKQVRKNLREGIEKLGVRVKALNIIAVPALVCLAGLLFGWYRRQSARR